MRLMGNVARPQLKLDAPRRVKTIGKHRLSRVRSPQRKMDRPTDLIPKQTGTTILRREPGTHPSKSGRLRMVTLEFD